MPGFSFRWNGLHSIHWLLRITVLRWQCLAFMRDLLLILFILGEQLGLTVLYEQSRTLHLVISQSLRTDVSQSHHHCVLWMFISIFGLVHFWELKITSPALLMVRSHLLGWLCSSVADTCLVLLQILVLPPLPPNKDKYCPILGCPFLHGLHLASQQSKWR